MYVDLVLFKIFQLGFSPLDHCSIHEIAKQTLCLPLAREFHLLSPSHSSFRLLHLSLSFELIKGNLDLIQAVLSLDLPFTWIFLFILKANNKKLIT